MNTGIQDAHNLAWKIAFVLRGLAHPSVLETYSEERRRIAIKNTCLSISNFKETVKVARAFGLDPGLANGVVNLLSSGQQVPYIQKTVEAFGDSLLSLGKMQTSPLNPLRPFQQLYLSNILTQEKSLRLLYPEEDIGFCYNKDQQELKWNGNNATADYSDSSKTAKRSTFVPKVKIGGRFPHLFLDRVHGSPCDSFSTIDLIGKHKHTFLLILHKPSKALALELRKSIRDLQQGEHKYAVTPVFVNCPRDDELAELAKASNAIRIEADVSTLKFESELVSNDLSIVCPDGHVADLLDLSAGCSSEFLRKKLTILGLKPSSQEIP
jgi:hypothetical protein